MLLSIKNLSKSFGEKCAVNNMSMELTPGIYGILGPNGAGKSTWVNMLVGNLKPNSGNITYNGEDTCSMGSRFREVIGYMPQQQGMYNFFTGFQFLSYIGRLKGIPKSNCEEMINSIAKQVNLSDKLHTRIEFYSGGMKQRLLLAQALLGNPEIIILDEPTAGLDPKERIRMKNIISKYSLNKIVIIVTHIVSDLEYIAKEIILFKDGEVVAKDSLDGLLDTISKQVYEVRIEENMVEDMLKTYLVSGIRKENNNVFVRVVTDKKLMGDNVENVKPVLEDKYLMVFGEKYYGEEYE